MKDVNPSTSATADLFISYAWTSGQHRAWVRLFASQLHLMGYSVLIDAEVDYGVSLNGFMREAVDASHVLMIADENYVSRANDHPDSGVGIENKWFRETFETKPTDWLSVIFVDNPKTLLPEWLTDFKPKGFDFNTRSGAGQFPGAEQLNDVWRWVNGLPAGRAHAVPLAQLRARSSRLEAIDVLRDPGSWASPAMSGRVKFRYADQPGSKFRLGNGEYEFTLQVSAGGANLIYVYSDPIKAVGLIGNAEINHDTVDQFLSPGRVVRPTTGQSVVLMNHDGNLCVVTIEDIQDEINGNVYTPPHVTFSYDIVTQE